MLSDPLFLCGHAHAHKKESGFGTSDEFEYRGFFRGFEVAIVGSDNLKPGKLLLERASCRFGHPRGRS